MKKKLDCKRDPVYVFTHNYHDMTSFCAPCLNQFLTVLLDKLS